MRQFIKPVEVPNGSITTYTLPSPFTYITGTIFAIVDGLHYSADDVQYGITEITPNSVSIPTTLFTGDVISFSFDDGVSDVTQVTGMTVQASDNHSTIQYNTDHPTITYNVSNYTIEYGDSAGYQLGYNDQVYAITLS